MAERQVASSLSGIRKDHVARYEWAVQFIGKKQVVVDAGCGCGYGSNILAKHTQSLVWAIDYDPETLRYAQSTWGIAGRIAWSLFDLDYNSIPFPPGGGDVLVAFEILEHLANPAILLTEAAVANDVDRLFASVPNQRAIPYSKERFPFHKRHYTTEEFVELLRSCGWRRVRVLGQQDSNARVSHNTTNGRTIVVDARR